MYVGIFDVKVPVAWYIVIHVNVYLYLPLDPPHTTVYNVTISSSLTPANLNGFDITISWTVSNNSVVGCYIYAS